MHIYSAAQRPVDRMASVGSTYAAANGPGPLASGSAAPDAGRTRSDVDTARHAAFSALRNDRFGTMLEKMSDPAAAGSLALAGHGKGAAGVDVRSAFSAYAENGE